MLIVIVSHPTVLEKEAFHINKLFDDGMQLFHLRKPDYTEKETEELLMNIKNEYYPNIALHHHHALAVKYGLKRVHFTEDHRKKINEDQLNELKQKGFTLSTSIHDLEDHKTLSDNFSYTFFGPVFESISKPGYKPKSILPELKKEGNPPRQTKIVGIGGVTPDDLVELHMANFDGAALMGSVWNSLGKEQNENGKA